MATILAFIQLILIILICFIEFNNKSSVIVMWGTLLIIFGIPHFWVNAFNKSDYSRTILLYASIFVIIFCLIYLFVRSILNKRAYRINWKSYINNINNDIVISNQSTNLFFYIHSISTIVLIIEMLNYSGGLLNTSWEVGREFGASLDYVNGFTIFKIFYFTFGATPLICIYNKKKTKGIISIILMMVYLIISRNRINIMPLFACLIAYIVFKVKQLKLKHVIILFILAFTFLYIISALRVFRFYGSTANFIKNFNLDDFMLRVNDYYSMEEGELGLRNTFYYFIKNNNNFDGFGRMATYTRMLFVYFPTKFTFGIKPNDFAQTMGAAIGMDSGGSMHPTLFGDCYANANWYGVFLGAFWAIYATIIDKILLSFKKNEFMLLYYVLNLSMYAIIGRGAVYNAYFYIAFGTMVLFVMDYLRRKVRIKL